MWLVTKLGFYSIVKIEGSTDQFMVRGRAKKDLENLVMSVSVLSDKEIFETFDADYHYRIIVNKTEFDILMIYLSDSVDYPNFKKAVGQVKNQVDKQPFYMDIWNTMWDYQFSKNKNKVRQFNQKFFNEKIK